MNQKTFVIYSEPQPVVLGIKLRKVNKTTGENAAPNQDKAKLK